MQRQAVTAAAAIPLEKFRIFQILFRAERRIDHIGILFVHTLNGRILLYVTDSIFRGNPSRCFEYFR